MLSGSNPWKNGEMTDYLQRILRARVYDVARETPWITPPI